MQPEGEDTFDYSPPPSFTVYCENKECKRFMQARRVDLPSLGLGMYNIGIGVSCACNPQIEMRRIT